MGDWALIRNGVVENTFIWDGEGGYQHDEGTIIVEYSRDNPAGVGYIYDGSTFSRPPLTEEEKEAIDKENVQSAVSQKKYLMDEATQQIDTLQDAVDLDMATDEEKTKLTAWKKYRILLNRVDTSQSNVTFPAQPS